jgi:hypothetical protein
MLSCDRRERELRRKRNITKHRKETGDGLKRKEIYSQYRFKLY